MTETQGNKRYVNYHMPLIISIINYTIVHVNWTKIICLIQQSIDSYKCNAMRTASELRTMNTNCTSICFPGSLHNLSIRSHLEPAPTGCLRAFRCSIWWSHVYEWHNSWYMKQLQYCGTPCRTIWNGVKSVGVHAETAREGEAWGDISFLLLATS